MNVASNYDGNPLRNTGILQFRDGLDVSDFVDIFVYDLSKTLIDQFHNVTSLPDVAIGEILTYQVSLAIPPTTLNNLHLVDTLDLGLAYLDCDLTVSPNPAVGPNLSTDFGAGSTTDFSQVCSNALVSPVGSADPALDGRQVDFDFGDLTNAGSGLATVTLTYEVVVLDSLGNQSGSTPP